MHGSSPVVKAAPTDAPSRDRLALALTDSHLPFMSQRALRDQVLQLPPAERLQLVEDIWESLAQSPDAVPVPDWHREVLTDRLADAAEHGTLTWEQVQANARRHRR